MTEAQGRIVIAGAGHAGGSAACFLRQYGWQGDITVVGEEPLPPYQRPPLSKAWLKGEASGESLALRPARFYEQHRITLRLGTAITGIDRAGHAVILADGSRLGYGRLILALGARARPIPVPGADLAGVLALRSAADATALAARLQPGARLAIIGGGYIGLEVAASARGLGAEVTVIEREARVLARVAGTYLSEHLAATHRRHGVTLLTSATVAAFEGAAGAVTGVRLADGTLVPAGTVLVGIGAVPNAELAAAAGLVVSDGIAVCLEARTSDPDIFAIGDCTRRPLPLYDTALRLESVPNAIEQAKQAAAAICGRPAPPPEVPWFWSDQYDLRLQKAGLALGPCRAVLRPDPGGGFAVFHLAADDLVMAVEAVNAPAAFMAGRMLVGKRRRVPAARLADPATSLKDLAA